MSGEGEDRDSLGRLYNFPTRDWLCERYECVSGWTIVDADSYIGGGFDKIQRDWLAISVRKDMQG